MAVRGASGRTGGVPPLRFCYIHPFLLIVSVGTAHRPGAQIEMVSLSSHQ